MSTTVKTYCRLCAKLKKIDELINLQTEEEKCQDIVFKLKRFHVTVDLNENIWPKTVCSECTESLECAFDFVVAVEQAQTTLNDYFALQRTLVRDESDSDHENIIYEPSDYYSNEDDIKHDKSIIDLNVTNRNDIRDKQVKNEQADLKYADFTKLKVNNIVSETSKNINSIENEHITNQLVNFNNIKNENSLKINEHFDARHDNITRNKDKNRRSIDDDKPELEKKINSVSITFKNIDNSQAEQLINRLASCPVSLIKQTWAEYNWKCAHCERQFVNIDELRSHSMQYHNACNSYQCTDCQRRTIRLDTFLKHVRAHRKYLHYSCYKCHMKLSGLHDASKHKATHISSNNICRGCNISFSSENELNEHVSKFYKNIISIPEQLQSDNLTCKICNWTFKSKSNFKSHVRTHTDRTRDHTCEVCGKGFYTKVGLNTHMIIHTDRPEHQCEICKYTFKNVNQLRYHATVHSGEKPFACDECGKFFRTKYHLKAHRKIHTDDSLPHICIYCNKRFRYKTALSRHIHQHTGLKPYSCVVCQREIKDLANFYKHMKRKHGIDKEKRKLLAIGPASTASSNALYPETDEMIEVKNNIIETKNKGRPRGEHSRKSTWITNKMSETENKSS